MPTLAYPSHIRPLQYTGTLKYYCRKHVKYVQDIFYCFQVTICPYLQKAAQLDYIYSWNKGISSVTRLPVKVMYSQIVNNTPLDLNPLSPNGSREGLICFFLKKRVPLAGQGLRLPI